MRADEPPLSARNLVRVALFELALLAILAAVLLALGRALTCPCGSVALWAGDIYSNQNSQQLADPYTFTHVTHGMIFYGVLRLVWLRRPFVARLAVATVLEVLWEVAENSPLIIDRYRETTASLGYYGDSVLNSVGDVLFCVVGFFIASRIPRRANVVAIVASEVILLFWIRDNITLNVLMLLYPIPAVRAWQLG
jgi:hypothetical protein